MELIQRIEHSTSVEDTDEVPLGWDQGKNQGRAARSSSPGTALLFRIARLLAAVRRDYRGKETRQEQTKEGERK